MKQATDKKDAVREEILSGARGLFQKYGLDKTTMEDIAEAAGKGKSTLYYYFKSKEDVFRAVAEEESADMLEMVEKALNEANSSGEKLRLFFTTHDDAIRNKTKLYPMVFKETKKHLTLFQRIQRQSNTLETRLFKSILLEGIASGEFKSIRKEECDAIAIMGVTTLHAMQLTLILEGKLPSESDRLNVMIDIFLRGLK
jgi:AcrR family transcriptional regulator